MIHRVSSLAALLGSLAILTSACTSGASDDDVDPVDADADGFEESIDCDDADATVFPGADETCDGRDEDCDGVVDEDPVDAVTYYPDGDGDGVGTAVGAVAGRCSPPDGFVALAGDCAPDDAAVYPGAAEVCWDGRDNDCDPETHGACGLSGVISTDDAHAKMGFPIGPCRAARVGGSPSLVCGGKTLRLYAGPFESLSTPRPTLLSLAGDRDNRSFALADLVGDSAVDLVTLSGEVFEGPLGSDSTASPLLDQIEADAVHQGDLDGDGRTDVVFEYETSLVVATGPLAAGPLEDQARLTVDPGGRFKARVGDVVGDQAQDLVVNTIDGMRPVDGRTTGTVALSEFALWGVGAASDVVPTAPWLGSDSLIDLNWTLWQSPLGGTPETSTARATINTVTDTHRAIMGVGDLDGDGSPELVYRDRDWVYVVPFPTSGETGSADAILAIEKGVDIELNGFYAAFIDDFDDDGINDLVIHGTVGGTETSPQAGVFFFFGSGE